MAVVVSRVLLVFAPGTELAAGQGIVVVRIPAHRTFHAARSAAVPIVATATATDARPCRWSVRIRAEGACRGRTVTDAGVYAMVSVHAERAFAGWTLKAICRSRRVLIFAIRASMTAACMRPGQILALRTRHASTVLDQIASRRASRTLSKSQHA